MNVTKEIIAEQLGDKEKAVTIYKAQFYKALHRDWWFAVTCHGEITPYCLDRFNVTDIVKSYAHNEVSKEDAVDYIYNAYLELIK